MLKLSCHFSFIGDENRKVVKSAKDAWQNLQALMQLLRRSPVNVSAEIEKPSSVLSNEIEKLLRKPFGSADEPFDTVYLHFIRKLIRRHHKKRLLIYCNTKSHIAKAAIKQTDRLAKWGLCANDIGALYEHENKHILWHEALHLFGADDCYDSNNPFAGTTCELDKCIMQYAPREGRVRKWPFICKKNVKKIQDCLKEHETKE